MRRKRKKIKTRVKRSGVEKNHLPSSSAYSRRVNREKKKLVKQTLFLIFQDVDEIAPQVPIISAPLVATSSASMSITGFGEPESELILVLNGEKNEAVTISDDGSFEVNISLDDGENTITAYSRDEAKNESSVTREYRVMLDTKAPKLEISKPENEASFEGRSNQDVVLEGVTDKDVKVYVNAHIVFPDDEGKFKYTLYLNEGDNEVEIVAKDKAGNSTKSELKLKFKL